jgi:transposase
LRDAFLPWLRSQKQGQFIFQQDNTPAHTENVTKQFFKDEKLKVLPWSVNSPDLNPIENLWGILKRRVNKRQPKDVAELLTTTREEWTNILLQIVWACIESLPKHMAQMIEHNRNKADY